MIDQFRADYLVRFADQFVPGGFRRLLDEGAIFANAHYAHIPTYTACGHATFMSGASPSLNGIVGNEWFERETGRRVTSVSDDNVKELGGDGAATSASPVRLIGSTLGDELRLASGGQSRVVGIAFKDRSAILPAGKRPNGAYWFDDKVGAFVSSTYYFKELPGWVSKFNRDVRPDRYFGRSGTDCCLKRLTGARAPITRPRRPLDMETPFHTRSMAAKRRRGKNSTLGSK
jgi:hypothetical protein